MRPFVDEGCARKSAELRLLHSTLQLSQVPSAVGPVVLTYQGMGWLLGLRPRVALGPCSVLMGVCPVRETGLAQKSRPARKNQLPGSHPTTHPLGITHCVFVSVTTVPSQKKTSDERWMV